MLSLNIYVIKRFFFAEKKNEYVFKYAESQKHVPRKQNFKQTTPLRVL